jgi:hypothetical protein
MRTTRLATAVVTVGVALPLAAGATAASAPDATGARTTSITYDSFNTPGYDLDDYAERWSNPYGLLEMDPAVRADTRSFDGKRFTVSATPFRVGADFSVYDHLKYMGVSRQAFPVPEAGSITFSADMTAATPGTIPGLVIEGVYGPAGSWIDPAAKPASLPPYSATLLQGQQAGVVLNMVDFCTGQLFDWFLSGETAFALVERLPTNVTGNTSNPACPGAKYVGMDTAYTQIIEEFAVEPGRKHNVAIRFTRNAKGASADYFLDDKKVATVPLVGVPLDQQGLPYTGIYPSLGAGEPVADQISSFSIGHGLFSLLDAYPFQHPEAPELSVSIPVGTSDPADAGRARLFGQGAVGSWDNFVVTTTR